MTQNLEPTVSARSGRKRGAQPGNRNAQRHGRRSAAAITARKLSTARLKALAHVAHAYDLLKTDDRFRISPIRPDQWDLLWLHDPQLTLLLGAPREDHSIPWAVGFGA